MTQKLKHAELGETPPSITKRIYGWQGLPNLSKPAKYIIENEGQEPRVITVSRRKRQVLEGLMLTPILSASYCRISDQVLPLRRDLGVIVLCTIYKCDPETGRDIYGVYTLVSKVRRYDGSVK